MNIYVGNLSYDTTETSLRAAFAEYGDVSSVNIIVDRDSGRPRGFGFVEMATDNDGRTAITGLNGKELDSRTLTVNEARPRESRSSNSNSNNYNSNRRY
jgi:RNA recognition motif-containing protein